VPRLIKMRITRTGEIGLDRSDAEEVPKAAPAMHGVPELRADAR
jgi:hypothetical protein